METGMTRGRQILVILAVLAVGAGATTYALWDDGKTTGADAGDPALVALGKTVYAGHCASCHGANLEGQPDWRRQLPEGGLPAPPHDESGHTWHHGDQLLFDYTKRGGNALVPSGFKSNMPGFGEVLSDREIWASLAFIKNSWPATLQARQERLNRQKG
jgi:mono/diheme cytochrome c family protein